ncbi:MAG TPA: phage holin [Clostridia bacterium]|nr:phage holin [Clostridia bacterium]
MKINWKVRLKNKAFLIGFGTLVIGFVYQVLSMFGIVPSVTKENINELLMAVVSLLGILGVVVDPTTDGLNDSDRALTYDTDYDVRRNE